MSWQVSSWSDRALLIASDCYFQPWCMSHSSFVTQIISSNCHNDFLFIEFSPTRSHPGYYNPDILPGFSLHFLSRFFFNHFQVSSAGMKIIPHMPLAWSEAPLQLATSATKQLIPQLQSMKWYTAHCMIWSPRRRALLSPCPSWQPGQVPLNLPLSWCPFQSHAPITDHLSIVIRNLIWLPCRRHAWKVWEFRVKQTLWRSLSRVCEGMQPMIA